MPPSLLALAFCGVTSAGVFPSLLFHFGLTTAFSLCFPRYLISHSPSVLAFPLLTTPYTPTSAIAIILHVIFNIASDVLNAVCPF